MGDSTLARYCPTCGAQPGDRCQSPSGFRVAPHSARKGPRKGITQRPTPRALEHRETMDELRPAVLAAYGFACALCGTARNVHVHHRLPTGRGGRDSRENLVALCADHHAWVHANPLQSYADGLLINSWDGSPTEPWARPPDPA